MMSWNIVSAAQFLSLLVTTLVSIVTAGKSASCYNDDSGGNVTFIPCNQSCSQMEPRFDSDTPFICTVGSQKEVDSYKKTNAKLFAADRDVKFEQPVLLGIASYQYMYRNTHQLESLSITFRLPKGHKQVKEGQTWYSQPQAVLMTFRSVADAVVQDKYYYECPRERIFRFHNYTTSTGLQIEQPRNITFDCFIGLDDHHNAYNVYQIILQAVEGHQIVYNVSFPVSYKGERRPPAIATSLDVASRKLMIVIELCHQTHRRFGIYVTNNNDYVKTKMVSNGNNRTTFTDLTHGKYFVKVWFEKNYQNGGCPNFTSYVVDATKIPAEYSIDSRYHYAEDDVDSFKLVAMVTGCVLGVTLVLVIAYCFIRKKFIKNPDEAPTGMILHPFTNTDVSDPNTIVLETFRVFLERYCDCTILADAKWQSNTDKDGSMFSDCSFVIVVCSPNLLSNQTTATAVKEALEQKTQHNQLHVIPVRFSYNAQTEPLPKILPLKEEQLLVLMKDINKLYCKINSILEVPEHRKEVINDLRYVDVKEGKDLFQALSNAQKQLRVNQRTPSERSDRLPLPKDSTNMQNVQKSVGMNQNAKKAEVVNIQKRPPVSTNEAVNKTETKAEMDAKADAIAKFRAFAAEINNPNGATRLASVRNQMNSLPIYNNNFHPSQQQAGNMSRQTQPMSLPINNDHTSESARLLRNESELATSPGRSFNTGPLYTSRGSNKHNVTALVHSSIEEQPLLSERHPNSSGNHSGFRGDQCMGTYGKSPPIGGNEQHQRSPLYHHENYDAFTNNYHPGNVESFPLHRMGLENNGNHVANRNMPGHDNVVTQGFTNGYRSVGGMSSDALSSRGMPEGISNEKFPSTYPSEADTFSNPSTPSSACSNQSSLRSSATSHETSIFNRSGTGHCTSRYRHALGHGDHPLSPADGTRRSSLTHRHYDAHASPTHDFILPDCCENDEWVDRGGGGGMSPARNHANLYQRSSSLSPEHNHIPPSYDRQTSARQYTDQRLYSPEMYRRQDMYEPNCDNYGNHGLRIPISCDSGCSSEMSQFQGESHNLHHMSPTSHDHHGQPEAHYYNNIYQDHPYQESALIQGKQSDAQAKLRALTMKVNTKSSSVTNAMHHGAPAVTKPKDIVFDSFDLDLPNINNSSSAQSDDTSGPVPRMSHSDPSDLHNYIGPSDLDWIAPADYRSSKDFDQESCTDSDIIDQMANLNFNAQTY